MRRVRPIHCRTNFSPVNDSARVGRYTLGRARVRRVLDRIGDERADRAVLRAADPDAALPGARPTVAHRAGLRISDVNVVLRVDVDPARTAELIPRVEELAVLIENLDP